MVLKGRTSRPTSQNTMPLPSSSAIEPTMSSCTASSQPSRMAREASAAITSRAPSLSVISCSGRFGRMAFEYQSGASRPAL